MWSEAARAASLQARSTGGSGNVAAAPVGGGNVAAQGAALQAGLAKAGETSRGQWIKGGKNPTQRVVIHGVAAHQIGVHGIARTMDAASAPVYRPNNYNIYPNVAY